MVTTVENEAELVTHIFGQMAFPFLAADLHAVEAALASGYDETRIEIDLSEIPDRREVFRRAMQGLCGSIDVPRPVCEIFSESPVLTASRSPAETLQRLWGGTAGYRIDADDSGFVWREGTVWPAAYRPFIEQLVAIYRREMERARSIRERGAEQGLTGILDHHTRSLPTRYHRAFASLGGWTGGYDHFAFLAEYATSPQLTQPGANSGYARSMNYSEQEAAALDASHMIAIPPGIALPLFRIQGSDALGVSCVNEFSAANPPKDLKASATVTGDRPGFLMDAMYATAWTARPLADEGLYGSRNVQRDHHARAFDDLRPSGFIRCKHYTAPVIDVGSVAEIRDLVERIGAEDAGGIHFRGQSALYLLDRAKEVRALLFAGSCPDEPSLLNSSDRKGVFYEPVHYALRYFLQNHILHPSAALTDYCHDPDCRFDYAVMALAQHYGLPSPGLDVTADLDVALWFATNALSFDAATGLASYRRKEAADFGPDPARWPVVLVLQTVTHSLSGALQSCESLGAVGLHAERPERQGGKFFLGGHSDHQNRLAEAVVCALRLKPGSYPCPYAFADLFPSPQEDDAYRAMLEFEKFVRSQGAQPHPVTRFHA